MGMVDWRALMNTVIKFRFPGKVGIFYWPSYSRPSITTYRSMALPHVADEGDGL
jgi:hypothetical protein